MKGKSCGISRKGYSQRMNSNICTSILSVVLFYSLLCEAIHVADVHRLFQMERANVSYGSQKTSFNLLAQSVSDIKSLENDYQQKVAIIRIADFSIDLLETITSRNAEAVLLLFPEQEENQDLTSWHDVELHLFQKTFKIPVYFAMEDPDLLKMYRDTLPFTTSFDGKHLSDLDGYSYQLVVSQSDPSVLNDLPILNIQVSRDINMSDSLGKIIWESK